MKLLNNTQKKQALEAIKFYKYVYICNICGFVYGSDKKELNPTCNSCELKSFRENKKKKNG